jgi:hypothetical protein
MTASTSYDAPASLLRLHYTSRVTASRRNAGSLICKLFVTKDLRDLSAASFCASAAGFQACKSVIKSDAVENACAELLMTGKMSTMPAMQSMFSTADNVLSPPQVADHFPDSSFRVLR